MTQRDGIHKLYHPHIAAQIPTGANSVADVENKILPVHYPAMSSDMVEDEIENMKIDLYIPGYLTGFMLDIDRMNGMYKMPSVRENIVAYAERLTDFKSILEEECAEIEQIGKDKFNDDQTQDMSQLKSTIKVELADLLGDIIVYCASEAKRWGIPIDRVLNIIMQSNFSKLDENGQPIYDERSKLQKGPNYWKPEPKIAELLAAQSGEVK